MADVPPTIVILAGPNGAGKTTASRTLLARTLKLPTYVNADVIAQGLAGFDPGSGAIEAGRILLKRLDELAAQGASFAFESTLAGRSLAGHDVPEATIRQRYARSLRNFFRTYRAEVNLWEVFDSSSAGRPQLVAFGREGGEVVVVNEAVWQTMKREADA
jgi:predicted ABC-type ATPase